MASRPLQRMALLHVVVEEVVRAHEVGHGKR